jgi:FlaA1/EpsC-like NDP-sugar epimerase
MALWYKFSSWYFSKNALPYWCILAVDSIAIILAGMFAIYLSMGGEVVVANFWHFLMVWTCTLPMFYIGMRLFHTYAGIFRYSSFADLLRVSCAVLIGGVLSVLVYKLVGIHFIAGFPWFRVFLITVLLAMIFMWSIRIIVKYLYDTAVKDQATQNVYIYGVQEGGVALAKSMRNDSPRQYMLKGFISSKNENVGRFLLGVRVHKANAEAVEEMKKSGASIIFISPLLSESFRENAELVNALTKAGVKIMMLPSAENWDGKSKLQHTRLHEVDIEDLLPRDKIEVDLDAIGKLLYNKRILITGAAGSIGMEMVHQVAQFHPGELVLVDQAETPMHSVRYFMAHNYPTLKCWTIVGSIANPTQMEQIFKEHRPEYVFHAAAYKHVPMMEDNPAMAVQNNVYGTRVIADLAVKYGTRKFVMISTDKAVNPTNVMGCSKRISEIYCQSLDRAIQEAHTSKKNPAHLLQADGTPAVTQFITTRFGNVLGSNGSVIPIFREQISKGGPVTVTHPDIIRYFMLIPEACQLVLEAGTMGKGGEIFIFDMGKPVRIADLAQRMIDLSGAKDVHIKFTGLRDGEKLYEEVLNDAELTKPTLHPKIKIASVREYPYEQALANEEALYHLSYTYDDMKIVAKMKEIVPEYKSQHSKYEVLDKD